MLLTAPERTWPSLRFATSSLRASARLSSSTARRETTMLPRARSIFRIWNGCGVPISGPTSRTGRMSTWLPGRNATAPLRSTVKPPFTRPKITPVTRWLSLNWRSSWVQDSSRRAFSRESTASPCLSSMRSRYTSTMSPTLISCFCPGAANSLSATRPSDFKPTSIRTNSFSIPTTVPLSTLPSRPELAPRVSSSSAANDSDDGFSFRADLAIRVESFRCCTGRPVVSGGLGSGCTNGSGRARALRLHLRSDESQCAFEHLIGHEVGGVDDQRVCRRLGRRNGAALIAGIPLLHVLQNPRVYSRLAAPLQLFDPAVGTGLYTGSDE